MRSKRPFVIVTRKLPDPIETRMMELFACQLNLDDTPLSKPELIAAVERADVLVPTVTDRIDAEVLEAAGPSLKLIASFGTGVDHVDLAAAQRRGIIVTNTPGVLTEDTADMTMALILAVSRRLAEGERLIRSGGWTGWGPTSMLGHRIWGKRLGIVGMGRIGMALARRAKGFGLSVHYHNRRPVPEEVGNALEATHWESLDQMLAHMDIVSVNCPHTAATYHLLSARRLRLLQPPAILVNTARGEIVDEEELVRLLENSRDCRRRSRRVRARAGDRPAAARPRQCRAVAAYGLGDDRRAARNGREGHHQHQDLRRRPPPARPRPRLDVVEHA